MSFRKLLLFLLCICAASHADEIAWRTTRTTHFIIYWSAGSETTASRAATLAEQSYEKLTKKLGFHPIAVTPVYLYPDRRSFAEAVGIQPSEGIVGLAHTRVIRIRLDASGAFEDISGVLPHELVHVFIFRELKGNAIKIPLWFHEGLAKYLAEDWTRSDAELLADAASGGDLLPLAAISKVFPEGDRKRAIAYVQSYSIVRHIADRYGSESLTDFLAEIKAGRSFEEALFYSIGRSPEELEEEWRLYIWDEYKFSRYMKLISGVVSALFVLLAILAFRSRQVQKRRKAEQFEHEDSGWGTY